LGGGCARTLPGSLIRLTARNSKMTRITLSCVGIVLLVGTAPAMVAQHSPQDYPQWRGRARDGAASGFSTPDS
jgi:hypothetical protein